MSRIPEETIQQVIAATDIVALVGDFLDAGDNTPGKLTTEECAQALSQLACREVVFIRGNHENEQWWAFADAWAKSGRPLHALHGDAFALGPLVLVGFPCLMGDDMAFANDRPSLSGDYDAWLPRGAARTLWLMHEPPAGTPLSQPHSPLEGNRAWTDAIEEVSPGLVIFGHDHQTPIKKELWHCSIGKTMCVNVGQTDAGPLH